MSRDTYQNKSMRIVWIVIFALLGYPLFLVITFALTAVVAVIEQVSGICFGISCAIQ
jgi:hypothetical protein